MQLQQNDMPLADLSPNEQDSLRNLSAANNIYQQGQKNGNVGNQWVAAAQASSQQNGIPLYWIEKTISRESNWNPTAHALGSSATGLGQFIHSTANQQNINPQDPLQSIYGVGNYLGQIKNQIGSNDFGKVTQAYVLGPAGYKQYQETGSASGSSQLPSVNKWLSDNNLLSSSSLISPTSQRQQDISALSMLDPETRRENSLMNSEVGEMNKVRMLSDIDRESENNIYRKLTSEENTDPDHSLQNIGALSPL